MMKAVLQAAFVPAQNHSRLSPGQLANADEHVYRYISDHALPLGPACYLDHVRRVFGIARG